MAGLNLIPIDNTGRAGGRKDLEQIPAEVAETIEEAFAYLQSPDAKPRLETEPFPTRDEVESFLRDARAYAYQRPAGRLVVTGNAARAKGNTQGYVARFGVAQYVEDEG